MTVSLAREAMRNQARPRVGVQVSVPLMAEAERASRSLRTKVELT